MSSNPEINWAAIGTGIGEVIKAVTTVAAAAEQPKPPPPWAPMTRMEEATRKVPEAVEKLRAALEGIKRANIPGSVACREIHDLWTSAQQVVDSYDAALAEWSS